MVQHNCYCTVGGPTCVNNTCTIQSDGFCYAFVRESYNEEAQIYEDEREWGCLGGNEAALMQCRGSFARHQDPKAMSCCRPNVTTAAMASHKCNENLFPEYVRRPDQEHIVSWSQMLTSSLTSPTFMWISGFLTLVLLFTCFLVILYTIFRQLWRYRTVLCCCSRDGICCQSFSTGSSSDSIIKEKNNHWPPDYSAATTKSSSISEDMDNLKVDISNLSSGDITSGHGGLLLNKRTIARDITLLEQIGQGRFGEVRRAYFKANEVAVKIFKSWDEASFRREDYIYTNYLKPHDNILGFVCSDMISRDSFVEMWLVTHYCAKHSLHEYLSVNTLTTKQGLDLIYSVINGLHYLHTDFECQTIKPAIAHRDLKSKNILMKCDNVACIADFGHSIIQLPNGGVDKGPSQELRVGTKRYMAPEVLDQSMLNPDCFASYKMADVYQFGLVLWEICSRTHLPAKTTQDIHDPNGDLVPQPYMLPYGDIVPDDPSIEDMIKVVCEDQYRPFARDAWFTDPLFTALMTLMDECWRPAPMARLNTFNIKKKIRDLKDGC